MPRMDGLTFLRILMEQHPMPVVIMSSLSQRGSDFAMEALRLGACDVLGKPAGAYSFGDLGPQLISCIKDRGAPVPGSIPAAAPRAGGRAAAEPSRGPPPRRPVR